MTVDFCWMLKWENGNTENSKSQEKVSRLRNQYFQGQHCYETHLETVVS